MSYRLTPRNNGDLNTLSFFPYHLTQPPLPYLIPLKDPELSMPLGWLPLPNDLFLLLLSKNFLLESPQWHTRIETHLIKLVRREYLVTTMVRLSSALTFQGIASGVKRHFSAGTELSKAQIRLSGITAADIICIPGMSIQVPKIAAQ